jgi:signal transduction histidine kinase
MRIASSLSNRIFLACTLLAALSLGFAFSFVNARATAEAEVEVRRGLTDSAALVDQQRAALTDIFTRGARLVADLPTVRAAVGTDDPPTVQPIAVDSRNQIKVDLLVLSDPAGRVLASIGGDATALPPATRTASLDEVSVFLPDTRGLLQVISVPILAFPPVFGDRRDCQGRVTVGFFLDDERAAQFKKQTGSELAFAAGGRVLATTLPHTFDQALTSVVQRPNIATLKLGGDDYLALSRSLPEDTPTSRASPASIIVLRSRTERLRFLNTVRAGLVAAFVVTIVLATVLSFGVARTVTRPLAAVTSAMRDVAATGDLTRKVVVRSRAWDDADARLLATAFNTLTDSIARFQREAAQKDRLSSLGRLSTVIAHEIRNPLMIIRATADMLARPEVTPAEIQEAVHDIDEEVVRLNRIVTEVLDFAKPIRFELAETDLNEVCRASAAAAWTGESVYTVACDLDPAVPPLVTDGERIRTVLVNIITNARHAVAAAPQRHAGDAAAATADVIVRTRLRGDRVALTVSDRGTGIAPEHMAHIFDPYFTTRRAGTGLGLPISKNIVEGLGGTIAVTSRQGEGTDIHIELPVHSDPASMAAGAAGERQPA